MPGARNFRIGGDEIDAGQQRADAGYLQRPEVVVDADAGRIGRLRQRRKRQPADARELADDQRDVDQQRAGGGQPEADRIEGRESDVAHAELQRHDEVHQPDDERHRGEEDHDGAVRREDLVVVLGRQVAGDWRASACCERIIIASTKPRSSITTASRTYITPMRLWSTLVIHSRQR